METAREQAKNSSDQENQRDMEPISEGRQHMISAINVSQMILNERSVDLQRTLVTWDGPEDPLNPKNWPRGRKWRALTAVSGFVLMSPLSTTIVAPSLDVIAKDLKITNATQKPLVLSIFLLGFGIGPLFTSPLSEIFGRTRVLQLFNAMYLVFNTGCGFARTKDQLIVLRFLSGLFGSASVGVSEPLIVSIIINFLLIRVMVRVRLALVQLAICLTPQNVAKPWQSTALLL